MGSAQPVQTEAKVQRRTDVIERIRNGLVVSCQAWPDSPLHGSEYMAAMAAAAAKGGAVGIRANGASDIQAIRQRAALPIIGIQKWHDPDGSLWITPSFREAAVVANAGAQIVAVDSRRVERPNGETLGGLFDRIHSELGVPVMADISSYEEARRAQGLGADLVATTFAIEGRDAPDFDLLAQLVESLAMPVVAEGLFWEPDQVCRALGLGVHAVVVGSAITRPDEITARFVKAIRLSYMGGEA